MTKDVSPRVWGLFKLYYPNYAGGATQGHRVLSGLAAQGFSVQVITAANHAAKGLAGQEIKLDGVIIRYLHVVRYRDWKFLSRMPFLRKLASYFNSMASSFSLSLGSAWLLWREGHPGEIVQLYSCNQFSFLVVWLARLRGMHPVIRMTLVDSGDDPGAFRGKARLVQGLLTVEAFHRAEAIVSISSALTENCRSRGLDKIYQIPNGVDLEVYHPLNGTERAVLRTNLVLRPDHRHIAFVGMALHRKGIDVLIDAFIQVAKRISDVDLLIIGPCEPEECAQHDPKRPRLVTDLQRELKKTGISSRAHWSGSVDNVHEFLQVADVFCLPTRREGLPNSVIEAMACGLPCVVSRLEGVTTDIISSEREGVLISGHNPQDYADAILYLLNNPARAHEMGQAARQRAVEEFSLKNTTYQYAQLYQNLSKGEFA